MNRRRGTELLFIVVFVLFVGVGCGPGSDEAMVTTLADVVKQRVAANDKAPIRLADVTAFGWDRVFLFPPYTAYDEVERSLGFRWKAVMDTSIASRDDVVLLVFTRANQVIRFATFPRAFGDLSGVHIQRGLSPSEAVFVAHLGKPGESSIVLRWDRSTPQGPPRGDGP